MCKPTVLQLIIDENQVLIQLHTINLKMIEMIIHEIHTIWHGLEHQLMK